jgi:hypothetical protein
MQDLVSGSIDNISIDKLLFLEDGNEFHDSKKRFGDIAKVT